MPADFSDWFANEKLLTTDELVSVIGLWVDAGITQVRLTRGEPLLRRDIVDVVLRIKELPKPPRISLTTNALRLTEVAQDLKVAGLERVNVSLDTLDPIRFKEMTHRDRFHDVIAGTEAAQAAGLTPLKVNAVLLKGINDDEAIPLLRHALANNWNLRFIEQMPLDAGDLWARPVMVTADEIQKELEYEFDLIPVPTRGSAPAEEFYVNGGPATMGIIASVTRPFCAACGRLRLAADGQFRNCLFARDETDVRAVLRSGLPQAEIDFGVQAIIESVTKAKLPGHGTNDPDFIKLDRPISAIGG